MTGASDRTKEVDRFKVIDAQVHVWLPKNDSSFPWAVDHPTGFFETQVKPHPVEQVISDMSATGVDAAIAVVCSVI